MPTPLVECIPNFSEARRPEIIEELIQLIKNVSGIHVLDRHSDLDHNRTVITYVGPPKAVEEAAFLAIACAAQRINLDEHVGAHPRIGASDVVPFVPISDVTMQDCIEMARRLGKRVGSELGIPVYLYEEAATRPDRQNLENIRRGQYEGLKGEIESNPDRFPDFGPHHLGPAGATVIGARQPLIAFNVYLNTNDTSIAQKIAKVVRHSSGGLRYVKAMGVLVEGRAQVSMNLTNYRQTPIARVVELIRREAGRYGVGIQNCELVGLLPQEALNDAAIWYLQLDQFSPEQILEQRMMELMRAQPTESAVKENSFLDALASATPAPGGGSAAAHTGAVGAALVAMVSRLTMGKKKYEAVKERMWEILDLAEKLRVELLHDVEADASAFEAVMAAFKLPKDDPQQEADRNRAIQSATLTAARIPLQTAEHCLQVQQLAVELAQTGNVNAISDAASASTLARAALACAAYNVRINLNSLEESAHSENIRASLRIIESQSGQLETALRQVMAERGGITQ
ncbi:MAG: glutamate formimidoyltransferase [Chloroflexota bacterium]